MYSIYQHVQDLPTCSGLLKAKPASDTFNDLH